MASNPSDQQSPIRFEEVHLGKTKDDQDALFGWIVNEGDTKFSLVSINISYSTESGGRITETRHPVGAGRPLGPHQRVRMGLKLNTPPHPMQPRLQVDLLKIQR